MGLKLLNLWDRHRHDESTDRAFFHNLKAIAKHPEVDELCYSGLGWSNWDASKTCLDNINKIYQNTRLPDLIITYAYKLREDYPGLKHVSVPKCLRWNEMTYEYIRFLLLNRDIGLCICHHHNDMVNWNNKSIRGISFRNVPHCASSEVFRNYNEDKIYDIVISGKMDDTVYPFRSRLLRLVIANLRHRFRCKILEHPGYRDLKNIPNKSGAYVLKDYSRVLNQSKIALTCSSKYRYALMKYIEIPMSYSLIAADLPNERRDFFESYVLDLDPQDSDLQITNKLAHYIENDAERETLTKKGYDLMHSSRTQSHYADLFVKEVKYYLSGLGKL
jgi:hypothetical protein